MPPDEDGGEPKDESKAGQEKQTKSTFDDKGKETPGNTLAAGGDSLRLPGKDKTWLTTELQSENKEYSLKFEDGNLVLKHESGNLLWSSETKGSSWAGDITSLKIGPDGSLRIMHSEDKHPSLYSPQIGWSSEPGMGDIPGARIVLLNDGSLVVKDDKNKTRMVISPPDDGKTRDVQLYDPRVASDGLRAYIATAETTLQQQVYQLGRGTPSAAPNLSELLRREGLSDKFNSGEAVEKYTVSVEKILEVKELLKKQNASIEESAEEMREEGMRAYNKIMTKVDTLDDFLREVDSAFLDKNKDGKHDYETEMDDSSDRYVIKPSNEYPIFKEIDACLDSVYKLVKDVSDWAERKKVEVEQEKPGDIKETNPGDPKPTGPNGPTGQNWTNGPNGTYQPDTSTNTPTGNQDFSGLYGDLLGGEKEKGQDGALNPDGTSADGTTGPGSNSEFGRLLNAALSDLEKALTGSAEGQNGAVTPGGAVQQAGYRGGEGQAGGQQGGSGGGGGMNPMMAMMPMMILPQLMAAMNKSREDREREREREEDERREEEREKEEATVAAAAAPQPPGAPAPGADMPAGATAAADATPPPPPPVGGPKTMVDMKLPDGSTQKVSSVVAQAVQKEMSNPMGSDARAAYAGTPGQSAPGSPWVSVESSNLRTGDVVQWTNRTGLLLVTDAGVQVLVNGQAVPLDPNNPPDGGNGDYGTFQGYFHPTGADLDDPGQLAAAGAAPPAVTSGPTSPPPPPAVPKPALDPR
ncbi:hypothetical protein [Nocardia cyriacigeorgica]|uniref:hypothetical protein n=1 Tax=Nocardia cyriacigeorgica TaxID=135487 RepID=UPI0002E44502|nr:hypothetical protein [Nocardia cyriacigeorgica]TLF55289.1 hypothetical protein FEK31_21075 [Nocardia cyriacigeorgica]